MIERETHIYRGTEGQGENVSVTVAPTPPQDSCAPDEFHCEVGRDRERDTHKEGQRENVTVTVAPSQPPNRCALLCGVS